jgi:hypothetical protein
VSPRRRNVGVEIGRHVSVAKSERQAELAPVTCRKSDCLSVSFLSRQNLKFFTVFVELVFRMQQKFAG